jgi:hypothetical protein
MLLNQFNARVFFLLLAARLVGEYLDAWGSERQDEGGDDCSGFATTALRQTACAWPTLYDGNRRNARDLYWYYEERGAPDITDVRRFTPGCLVFYRRPGGADTFGHVAIHAATVPTMSRHGAMIEVGPLAFETGGGRTDTDSPWRALLESARIRLTATDQHPLIAFVAKDPFILLG